MQSHTRPTVYDLHHMRSLPQCTCLALPTTSDFHYDTPPWHSTFPTQTYTICPALTNFTMHRTHKHPNSETLHHAMRGKDGTGDWEDIWKELQVWKSNTHKRGWSSDKFVVMSSICTEVKHTSNGWLLRMWLSQDLGPLGPSCEINIGKKLRSTE